MDFEQNLSSLRLPFNKLIGRSHTRVVPALLIKYRKQHSVKNACNYLLRTRNKIQVRRFGNMNLSAIVNIAKYMYTLLEYKTKYQEEVAKIKSMLFQAKLAICPLYVGKIRKTTNYTKRHYFESNQPLC